MKLSVVVLTAGNSQGKVIPIPLTEFLIGRDPNCHLRPASPLVSKRHCALLLRNGKAFVRDFDSTNGTLVNDQSVKGERELTNGDRLAIGPLLFEVRLEATPPVDQPTPLPATRAAAPSQDEEAAAMLLALQDSPAANSPGVDSQGVPTGSTLMEALAPDALPPESQQADQSAGAARYDKAKQAQVDTSAAAKAILDKYIRRPRH